MAHVLIIDDQELMCDVLKRAVEHMGHAASCAYTLADGMRLAEEAPFDVVYLDVYMTDGNGLDKLPHLKALPSAPETIIITGRSDPDGAELAIKSGAWDYVQKGDSLETMMLSLTRAVEYRKEKQSYRVPKALRLDGIAGSSPSLQACFDRVAQAAATDASVLITGETGCGKELLARAIHNNSRRVDAPFVVVDCAAIPENLAESILFGHRKGSFTSADRSREGLVAQADGGTLFLDEVGELPMAMQKNFLRVLQEHRFRPVGASKEQQSDFRLLAATNRDLTAMCAQRLFREDLYYRLRAMTVEVPPLRERPGDIQEIAALHLGGMSDRSHLPIRVMAPDFIEALETHSWPGNARELVHALEHAVAEAGDSELLHAHALPTDIRVSAIQKTLRQPASGTSSQKEMLTASTLQEIRERAVTQAESKYLRELVVSYGSDIRTACRVSGLSRSRLYALLQQHGISRR